MDNKQKLSLVGIFIFFLLIFNQPLIGLPSGIIEGIPLIMIYIGSAWIGIIIIMWKISNKKSD